MYYLIFLPLTTFTNQVALPENDSQKKENREINDLSKKKSLNQWPFNTTKSKHPYEIHFMQFNVT